MITAQDRRALPHWQVGDSAVIMHHEDHPVTVTEVHSAGRVTVTFDRRPTARLIIHHPHRTLRKIDHARPS